MESKLYELVRPILTEALAENWLPESLVDLRKNKTDYSIRFGGAVIVKLGPDDNPYLELPTAFLRQSEDWRRFAGKGAFAHIPVDQPAQIMAYSQMIKDSLQYAIDGTPKDYDCCSRYQQCSDAMRCVHPDGLFALQCGYRKILKSGRIFYGVNRNVD